MKVQVSHRLDEGLLGWATSYGETRSWSRAVVIEEALRHFRGLCEGGVPDLVAEEEPASAPVVYTPVFTPSEAERAKAEREMRAAMGARQRRLNEEKERAQR